jgi:hypothetical protein
MGFEKYIPTMMTSYRSPVHAAEAAELRATVKSKTFQVCEIMLADRVRKLEQRTKHSTNAVNYQEDDGQIP